MYFNRRLGTAHEHTHYLAHVAVEVLENSDQIFSVHRELDARGFVVGGCCRGCPGGCSEEDGSSGGGGAGNFRKEFPPAASDDVVVCVVLVFGSAVASIVHRQPALTVALFGWSRSECKRVSSKCEAHEGCRYHWQDPAASHRGWVRHEYEDEEAEGG